MIENSPDMSMHPLRKPSVQIPQPNHLAICLEPTPPEAGAEKGLGNSGV